MTPTRTQVGVPEGGYYPVFVRLAGCKVLAVGGGPMAEQKVEAMLAHGARVHLLAQEVTAKIQEWTSGGRIEWYARAFAETDLDGCALVFCATSDAELNARVSRAAQDRGIPVNVVDVPGLCSFIVPSILRRGHLSIAVSTDGLCPSFSRHLRQELEGCIDDAYGEALEVLEVVREKVYDIFRGKGYDTRRRALENVLALDVPHLVRTQGPEAARDAALRRVAEYAEEMG